MAASTIDSVDGDRRARKNVYLLAAAQALYGANTTIVMTIGGIVGYQLAADKALATLPITTYMIGTVLTTVPASMLMRKVGRRAGFMLGALFAVSGAVLAMLAIMSGSFALFCLATGFTGAYQAFAQYYRFAATDTASVAFKPKAISWVLAGGVVAAFAGPMIMIWSKAALAPALFAGTFAVAAGLAIAALSVLHFIDIPKPADKGGFTAGRPLREIIARPRFVVAVLCGMITYASMTLMMTASPLAMLAADHSVDDAAFVVQWHAVAMFAPSFFTGHLIVRFGARRVVATGMALLAGSGAIALSGYGFIHFWVALVLLGMGWNFGFVGATSMVTDCHREAERNKVQAANDLMVFSFVAAASLSSGALLNSFGWHAVGLLLFPFAALCVGLLAWLSRAERRVPRPETQLPAA